MNNRYPEWLNFHVNKNYTVREWLELIAEYYATDFNPSNRGRPSMLTKEVALALFGEYVNTGYMVYALDKLGLNRSTEWRWRNQYRSVRDMHVLVDAYIRWSKKRSPYSYYSIRQRQLRILQRQRGSINSLYQHYRGRPSLYRDEYPKLVKPTMQATADELSVCKRTLINWMKEYPDFNRSVLLRRLEWQLPLFDRQYEGFAKQLEGLGILLDSENTEGV